MFTNHKDFGGNFGNQFEKDIKKFSSLEIASGYFGTSSIDKYETQLLDIAKKDYCRILIGMIYHEGVSKSQKKVLEDLHKNLLKINKKSGVFISLRPFHGKIFKFSNKQDDKIYVGSSNFSNSGFFGNIEFNTILESNKTKLVAKNFLNHLYSGKDFTSPLDKVELFIKNKKKIRLKDKLKSYEISKDLYPTKSAKSKLDIKLRVDQQPRSSLNLYFEKGRKNTSTGKYSPRPWNEVEITTTSKDRNANYPKGDFNAYVVDDNKYYKINMITASDNYKAITSKDNREILGELIKGKLERNGFLKRFERITLDTLRNYGKDFISLRKIDKKNYYLDF